MGGLEPPTPASQTRCATNCATPRYRVSIPVASGGVKKRMTAQECATMDRRPKPVEQIVITRAGKMR